MEAVGKLFENKKFVWIFSSFLGLIGLIFIFRKKPEIIEENSELNELQEKLKQSEKTLKLIKRKNKELEEKANGKQISGASGERRKSGVDDSRKEGPGTAKEGSVDELDEQDDEHEQDDK